MKKLVLAFMVLALCNLSLAETQSASNANHQAAAATQESASQAAPRSPFSTAECSFTFTSGANNTFLKYCVTANGNIAQLETPLAAEHIAFAAVGEGYGICDFADRSSYTDYAGFGDSGNWGPASVVSQNTKSVKIARTTSDGVWTLTQTITQVVAGTAPSVKIAMTLKNNTTVIRRGNLLRYADVDAGSQPLNNLGATKNDAFGWNSGALFGLMLQNVGTASAFPNYQGFAQNTPSGPDPCTPLANVVPAPQTATDGSVLMLYRFEIAGGKSVTATVAYKGM